MLDSCILCREVSCSHLTGENLYFRQREERQKMAAQRREDQNKKETQNKRAKHSSTSQINSGDELNKMSKIR